MRHDLPQLIVYPKLSVSCWQSLPKSFQLIAGSC